MRATPSCKAQANETHEHHRPGRELRRRRWSKRNSLERGVRGRLLKLDEALAGLRSEVAQNVGEAIEIGLVGVANRIVRREQFNFLHVVDHDVLAGQAVEAGRSGGPRVRNQVETRRQRVVERPGPVGQGPLLQSAVAERTVGRGVFRRTAVGHIERIGIGEKVVFRTEVHRLVFADEASIDVVGVRRRDGDLAGAPGVAEARQPCGAIAAVGFAGRQRAFRAERPDIIAIGRALLAVGRDIELAVVDLHLAGVLRRAAASVRAGDRSRGMASEGRVEDPASRIRIGALAGDIERRAVDRVGAARVVGVENVGKARSRN